MGAVYVVEHVNTGGLWALKVMLDCTKLQAERASRFRREARASARITSEHVVKVTDADTAPELDGAPFLVMELLDGTDVERLLAKRGRLEPREVVDILAQVARGLDRAHAAGVVHRDLKPENIFMHRREDGSSIVKVLDFGISKVLRPDGDMSTANVTGATDVMGTPLYMAPEQAAARHEQVGPPTDVWAIGLMTIRMLTGQIYWQGDTIAEVFVQIMSATRWPPSQRWPQFSPAFDAWFQRSTAPRPADRFQSVGHQVTELAALLTGEKLLLQSNPETPGTLVGPVPPRTSSDPSTLPTPQQLVTQVMAAPDKSSQRPVAGAVGIGVSTAEPVTSVALPLHKPTRGLAIGASVAALAVAAVIAFSISRHHDPVAAGRDSGPTSPFDPSSTSTTASGAGGVTSTPPASVTPPVEAPPIATTAIPVTSAVPPAPPVTPVVTPPVTPVTQPVVQPITQPVINRPPVRPNPPTTPTTSAKPPTKPGDLFDTQK
jgi:serine/threonine protein kinase